MFDNITEKLKTIANVLFKLAVVVSIIMGIAALVLLGNNVTSAVSLLIGAAATVGGTYVSSALIYGFAILIEKISGIHAHVAHGIPTITKNTETIANNTQKQEE